MAKTLYDPTFVIQREPPNSLASLIAYPKPQRATLRFKGKNVLHCWPATEHEFTAGELVILAQVGESFAFLKADSGYPTRWGKSLTAWAKTHGANLFLRFILDKNQKYQTYKKGVVAQVAGEFQVIAAVNGRLGLYNVEYMDSPTPAEFFQAGDFCLIYHDGEGRETVIGFIDQEPRSEIDIEHDGKLIALGANPDGTLSYVIAKDDYHFDFYVISGKLGTKVVSGCVPPGISILTDYLFSKAQASSDRSMLAFGKHWYSVDSGITWQILTMDDGHYGGGKIGTNGNSWALVSSNFGDVIQYLTWVPFDGSLDLWGFNAIGVVYNRRIPGSKMAVCPYCENYIDSVIKPAADILHQLMYAKISANVFDEAIAIYIHSCYPAGYWYWTGMDPIMRQNINSYYSPYLSQININTLASKGGHTAGSEWLASFPERYSPWSENGYTAWMTNETCIQTGFHLQHHIPGVNDNMVTFLNVKSRRIGLCRLADSSRKIYDFSAQPHIDISGTFPANPHFMSSTTRGQLVLGYNLSGNKVKIISHKV